MSEYFGDEGGGSYVLVIDGEMNSGAIDWRNIEPNITQILALTHTITSS